ncbi:ATPase, T2SS/T4P/T4SS family (plasmid) [Bacillus subtilis]|uniref:ATPase, T2SS/T4P/T4SS family n=1 Tax=Bacillus inaquosorum TaxID=483913 RepID=UPI002280EB00|nr:ATPase, T2SS/T4P/T4SS family [Bacillus inaquosorum]MCY9311644.1 Flp pilus assembly complex ATPase component TadA [Bacillus inaquosorum]WEY90779.1 ATPase, T2SS/T4P/T4SS family [Bacillus subtilis]WEY94584.1 ATPase, T2SS/T4P/T4SS family [Bacillus subtilis]
MVVVREDILKGIADDIKESNPKLYLDAFTDEIARESLAKLIFSENDWLDAEALDYVMQQLVGLGVIEEIIKDHDVTDISYNGTDLIVNTNNSGKYIFEKNFSEDKVIKIIQKIANAVKKEFTQKNPILDAQLKTLRLNAVHKVSSPYGTTMALRVARPKLALTKNNFENFAPIYMYDFFEAVIKARANILIAGEVGTGKTEFQKLLMSFVPFDQKIVWIEDVREGHIKELFPEKDVHSYLTNEITSILDLTKAGLRNNSAWISVAEIRGFEALELLNAVLSGHNMVTTLHSVNAKAIPKRFSHMVKMGYDSVDEKDLINDIKTYINFGVHIKKTTINGKVKRYLSEVVEYRPDGDITIFKQTYTKKGFEIVCNPYSSEFENQLIEQHSDYDLDYLKEWENEKEKTYS